MAGSPTDVSDATTSRRLAAILAADIAGYSALMGADEEGTVRTLKGHQAAVLPLISKREGRVVDTAGDGILAEFPSVLNALRCALDIQRVMDERNTEVAPGKAMRFRIGVNLGDVIVESARVYGDGVNVAARLQALAQPGGIVASASVRDEARERVEATFEDLGEYDLKNIARKVRAFGVQAKEAAAEGTAYPSVSIPASAEQPALAVLPFNNMSGDPEQEYFADGITEDIITALSRAKWFSVIARNSSFTYKGRAVDVRQVGRELGVRYVLEGSVRKSGNRLRITGQLIDAKHGHHVWAQKYDGELADVFELQDRVTEAVAGAIEPSMRQAEILRSRAKPTDKLDAYDHYLRALPNIMATTTREANDVAVFHLRRAIVIDPNYAVAHSHLALACALREVQRWATPEELEEGRLAAETAIALQSDDPLALGSAGFAVSFLAQRVDEGLRCVERAHSLNPNSARVLMWSGYVNYYAAREHVAVERFLRAMKLSPIDPEIAYMNAGLAFSYFGLRQYEEGIAAGRRAVAEGPKLGTSYRSLIINLVEAGYVAEARDHMATLLKITPYLTHRPFWSHIRGSEFARRFDNALREAGMPDQPVSSVARPA